MSKSHLCRVRHNDYEWLKGDVLDVGCGPDAINLPPPSTVRPWDLEDGDAQLLEGLDDKSFDVVCGSHVLEHVRCPFETLKNWSRVLREGGWIYALLPLYSAYEKFNDFEFGSANPSRFNDDHKSSWDIITPPVTPTNHPHYGYKEIVHMGKEAGLTLMDLRIELDGYNFTKWHDQNFDNTRHGALSQLCIIYQKI